MATTEERLAALETQVAEMRLKLDAPQRPGVIGRTRPDFLERFFGMYANNPEAQEVLRAINEEREHEREEARRMAAGDKAA